MQVVWLKRDLRLRDHAPLAEACARGPVVVLFIVEPWLWERPPYDPTHFAFVRASLEELDVGLRALGGRLTVRVGRAVAVLDRLHDELRDVGGVTALWSHQETGLLTTYARDRAVRRWCAARGVQWTEHNQDGVWRAQPRRDGFAGRWEGLMKAPLIPAPGRVLDVSSSLPGWDHGSLPVLGACPPGLEGLPPPGEAAARAQVTAFLAGPIAGYRRGMSAPDAAWEHGSRLSAALAWGVISARTVAQLSWRAQSRAERGRLAVEPAEIEAFVARLAWRAHFMQKLEDEPELELREALPAMRSVRQEPDDERLAAWREGRTGYPMVDACMRSLATRRWLNFRMRAMVVSFACYDLWLPWKAVADTLAPWFIDFEPGIHYPQAQMQSGSTGANALRVYDPVKQALDHDPTGAFIQRWVPELRGVDVHDPAARPPNYPAPLVPQRAAGERARRWVEAAHAASPEDRAAVVARHGSRRRGGRS